MKFNLDDLHTADVAQLPFELSSEEDTARLGVAVRRFFDSVNEGRLGGNHTIGVSGDIGAGKTTFSDALAGLHGSFNSAAVEGNAPTFINTDLETRVRRDNHWIDRDPSHVSQKTVAQDGLVISWSDASWFEFEKDNIAAQNRVQFMRENPEFSFSNSLEVIEHPECCQWGLEMDAYLDLIVPDEDERDEDDVVEAFLYIDRSLCEHPAFEGFLKSCSDLLSDEFEGVIPVETSEVDVRL